VRYRAVTVEDAEKGIDFNATQPCDDLVPYRPTIVRETAAVVAAMGTGDDAERTGRDDGRGR
jgi:hypothetical protein